MAQFGSAPVFATKAYTQGKFSTLLDAWDFAISQYSESNSIRGKVCPKDAYLGLCECGLVKGIPAGKYGGPARNVNGRYAVDAYRILKSNPTLAANKRALWDTIPEPRAVNENNQIDVVVSLLRAGMLV